LLYAIEASSVASTRYFLKLKTEKWFINTKEESAYNYKGFVIHTLSYEGQV